MVKTFTKFNEDEELNDFEEDLIVEKPPVTADAMKRYKAGKAGFTDKAHLKAKGLIPRADGSKVKSDKYKEKK
jgi:predicted nucleic-acid-binding protein|tara:strand:- start:163 stop:381 length:219 start_codon:yes stop_codon:yes gene_type:complete